MTGPGSLPHLVRRFFGSLRVHRPGPADQTWIAGLLRPAEARLFWAQPVLDQDHALAMARRVAAATDDPAIVRAALLHDVGKRHSHTGVIGRSMASGLALLRLPVRGRWRAYLDHGALGADDLLAAGSDDLVVEFARLHHGTAAAGLPADAWAILAAADR